jgi:uncharacterized phage protein (TIGR01671 family)
MRTIKFRGKKISNNEWSYGCYFYNGNEHGIVNNKAFTGSWVEVHPETVGQFTGLQCKNGDVYEGDIIKDKGKIMKVIWKKEACQFWLIWKDFKGVNRFKPLSATYGDDTDYLSNDSLEIIGNIHENKGGENA